MRPRHPALSLIALALAAAPLVAQSRATPEAARRAAETITEADVRHRIGIIADDSMRGRATPSPELEQVAAYIAGEFRRFGLRPGGDNGSYLQRYPIVQSQLDSSAFAMVMGNGAHGHWMFARDIRMLFGTTPEQPVSGPVVLVVGVPADTANPFGAVSARDAIVLQVLPAGQMNFRVLRPMLQAGTAAGVKAWILVTDRSAAAFAPTLRSNFRITTAVGGPSGAGQFPLMEMRDSTAMAVLRAAGEDFDAIRAPGATGVRMLNGFTATVNMPRRTLQSSSAPNVIGILEGSDPTLRSEYVFMTAHMDHIGTAGSPTNVSCRAAGADSICNGADDDASGTTTVLELAQAFSSLQPRPRRSIVFMTVSGEERGLWGSEYYSEHPTLPLASTVADINIDMVGRYFNNQAGWTDTIVVIGKEHSDLGASANRVVRDHPELHMNLIDDIWPSENFYRRSDHFNFARKGVPVLFFFNGTHPDYHRATDSVDKIDAEKMMRIGRMVFYLGLDIADNPTRPQWNPASRHEIVETP